MKLSIGVSVRGTSVEARRQADALLCDALRLPKVPVEPDVIELRASSGVSAARFDYEIDPDEQGWIPATSRWSFAPRETVLISHLPVEAVPRRADASEPDGPPETLADGLRHLPEDGAIGVVSKHIPTGVSLDGGTTHHSIAKLLREGATIWRAPWGRTG